MYGTAYNGTAKVTKGYKICPMKFHLLRFIYMSDFTLWPCHAFLKSIIAALFTENEPVACTIKIF